VFVIVISSTPVKDTSAPALMVKFAPAVFDIIISSALALRTMS
jgi:hypothetical protein